MDTKSSNYDEALRKFTEWMKLGEKKLDSACYCDTQKNRQEAVDYHHAFQAEIEDIGKKLNCELKRHLSDDKSITKREWDRAADLEADWHKIWLRSLEQLVILERTKRCPKHNSTIIGKSQNAPANKSVSRNIRIRPNSFPNNSSAKLEWDYDHTLNLTGCHEKDGSQTDLDSVEPQEVENLTQFGENYEKWFGKQDEVAELAVHSRPPSVEPREKPELAKAIVSSDPEENQRDVNCNLLMLTYPTSMLTIDATKCPQNRDANLMWRVIFFFALVGIIISAIYQGPHSMNMSYSYSTPPV